MKKILIALFCLLLFSVAALFVACDDDHTHAFGEWTTTKAATCTEAGTKTRTCECGESESDTVPATGHSYGAWQTETAATCADGVEKRSCACGASETRALAGSGIHSWNTDNACSTCGKMLAYTENLIYLAEGESFIVDGVTNRETITAVVIPPYHQGKPVVGVGIGAFTNCTSLVSVEIPASVTAIGENAFENCTSLFSVNLPEGITEIGSWTFADCEKLVSITLPATVNKIGNQAFANCKSLLAVNIPDEVSAIGEQAFQSCYALYAVQISAQSKLQSIGTDAFRYCSSLLSFTVPAGVTSIGSQAFYYCDKLLEVFDLSTALTLTAGDNTNGYIANYAKAVRTAAAQSYVSIDDNGFAFYDDGTTRYLMAYVGTEIELVLPADCAPYAVYGHALKGTSVRSLTVSAKVTALLQNAFVYVETLESVSFAANGLLTEIGYSSFSDCMQLRSVTLSEGIELIGGNAFSGCTGLISIAIPASVTKIDTYAFAFCTSLRAVDFTADSELQTIASSAFYGDRLLSCFAVPAKVTAIGDYAFSDCTMLWEVISYSESIVLSVGSNAYGKIAANAQCVHNVGDDTRHISVDADGYIFYVDTEFDFCLLLGYRGTDTALVLPASCGGKDYIIAQQAFFGQMHITSVTVPAAVTEIRAEAFRECQGLVSVTFAENARLSAIKSRAFYNCGALTAIHIPASVTTVENSAFASCSKVASLTFAANSQLKTVGESAFTGFNGAGLTTLTLPASITSMAKNAFNYSGYTTVVLPANAKLAERIFTQCIKLTSIQYQGTVAEWQALSKGANWDQGTGEYTVTCTDGTVSKSGTVTMN